MEKSINTIQHINRTKEKKSHDHLRWRQSVWQTSTLFHDKTIQQTSTEGNYLNKLKATNEKPTANIIFSSEKQKTFPLQIMNKARMRIFVTSIQHSIRNSSQSN
jgi:hypothetical protein